MCVFLMYKSSIFLLFVKYMLLSTFFKFSKYYYTYKCYVSFLRLVCYRLKGIEPPSFYRFTSIAFDKYLASF